MILHQADINLVVSLLFQYLHQDIFINSLITHLQS